MAGTESRTKKDPKKPTVQQVREKKLQVSDAEIGKVKAGQGPGGPPPWSPLG